jgi:RHS repeat-associated protein
VNDNGYLAPFTANALNQYTNINGSTPEYDPHFNLYRFGGMQYDYDAPNRLVAVNGNGHSASFTYDGLGRCVRRIIDGVTGLFTYDGWNPIYEWDAAGNWSALNIYGAKTDEILGRYDAAFGPMIYKQDNQGNVVFLLSGNNQIIERYTYDAYGRPTVTDRDGSGARSSSNYGNRFMHTGREWLGELGIYDFRNRFYNPDIGRFLQTDPLGFDAGDMNLFRYCGNDPINRSDPLGLHDLGDEWELAAWNRVSDNGHNHDFDYDVRYGMTDDLLGWEAASYMKDVFARNDAASQRFAEYSAALYESSRGLEGSDTYTLGLNNLQSGYVSINGKVYFTTASVVKALQNAKTGSVNALTFVGHGSQDSIQIGFTGVFLYRSNFNGGYNFSFNGYSNINAIFSSLSPNAVVNFYGCNTASGDMNLTRAFSTTFPSATVTGYVGDGRAQGIPFIWNYWGTERTYVAGVPHG